MVIIASDKEVSMGKRRLFAVTAASLLLASAGFVAASANQWSGGAEPNQLTFSGPVALPGVVLPAGTYTFESASSNNLEIVRVLGRGRKPIFMGYTRTVDRPRGLSPDHVVTFGESSPGSTPPIAVWFPIDSAIGHEFIY
jgi:hypothetical protein